MKMLELALDVKDLLRYANGSIAKPMDMMIARQWKKADASVCIILINAQLSHLTSAADIWAKV